MTRRFSRMALASAAVLALAAGATACGSANGGSNSGGNANVNDGFKIGLALPEAQTARYEKFDKPYIEQDIHQLCPKCQVLYANAANNADNQATQVHSLITQGIKVLLLDAVDYKAAGASVKAAHDAGIPVVSYDRKANGPITSYVSFDNVQVGKDQGQALLDAIKAGGDPKRGQVVMINGSPTDPNAADFKQGAESVLQGQVNIGREYDTPKWDPPTAQSEMQEAITALGGKNIIGVYSANDGMAAGIAAAMTNAGLNPFPPMTGQDAQIDGIQRIVGGQQTMTIYKPIKPEAQAAAEAAIDAATGKTYQGNRTVSNDVANNVPAQILTPVVVTKANIASTVVADGFWTVQEICTPQYAAACAAIGLH